MTARYAIILLAPAWAWAQPRATPSPLQEGTPGQIHAIPEAIQKLYARMDADDIMDHAPEAQGQAPAILPEFAAAVAHPSQ